MTDREKEILIILLLRRLKGRVKLRALDFRKVTPGWRLRRVHLPRDEVVEISLQPPEVTIEGEFRVVR